MLFKTQLFSKEIEGKRRKGKEGLDMELDAGKISEMSAQTELFILKMKGSGLNSQLALLFI